ncbi:HpcH/HpaI aldolase family protein [Glaciimonas immobilis]|uniref:4-hydroxy-2-oxoheptanedioate aldolase n=1 Tax=Glaciimonas immobilis TaxID=728004 RepID=A0A840RS81_9BURK|nr:aldolase/citrate lyase family protein [Glaciimonas immobilis]KAF3997030.1 siderophore biosynthesis protein SbnG [Glaciimonas immobilis]MBB5199868.1 4-hydroxy-2-oxoheptanedioate aldolase [Glaciimonas immobilis]
MRLKEKLLKLKNQDRLIYGLSCATPAALSVELISAAGYDFVTIDLEHTLIGPEQLCFMLLAARASGIPALVKIAAMHQVFQALDAGAEGIIFPRIASVRDAKAAVKLCHFFPLGERGLNSTWHSHYGRYGMLEAMNEANRRTLVVAMIEDQVGVAQANAIAAIEGIDILLEGAADLSQSLGLPWQTRHPRVKAALSSVRQAAQRSGKHFCALPRTLDDYDTSYQNGVRMFMLGDERGIARRAMTAHLEQHRARHVINAK